MISEVEAYSIVEQLSAMKFFPADPGARVAVLRLIQRICHDFNRAQWLADRTADLYTEWPGPAELRAVYSSKWKPADGIEGNSAKFQDGVPSEREQRAGIAAPIESLQVEGGGILMLSAPKDADRGEPVSADPELCKLVDIGVRQHRMKPAKINPNDPIAKKLEQMGL